MCVCSLSPVQPLDDVVQPVADFSGEPALVHLAHLLLERWAQLQQLQPLRRLQVGESPTGNHHRQRD